MATRATDNIPAWRDVYWWSNDGVRLHARLYGAAAGRSDASGAPSEQPPVLCIPGLTRNARDFDRLAPVLAARRPVYVLNLRGRGDSGYARDPLTYVPLTYVQDVVAMLAAERIARFSVIGTSLGGIVGMLLAATHQGRIAAAVLNDIGPAIDPRGLARIRASVGQTGNFPTWVHAARAAAAANADIYPDWTLDDWLVFVKRTHRVMREGRIVADYDGNIGQPLRVPGGTAGVDLASAFDAMRDVPTLLLRGALSDILSADAAAAMMARLNDAQLVTLDRVGHAPTLDEAVAGTAITALLNRVGV